MGDATPPTKIGRISPHDVPEGLCDETTAYRPRTELPVNNGKRYNKASTYIEQTQLMKFPRCKKEHHAVQLS